MVTWTIPEDTINLDAQVVITWTVFSSAICYLSSQNTKLLKYYQNLAGCNSLLIYHLYSVFAWCCVSESDVRGGGHKTQSDIKLRNTDNNLPLPWPPSQGVFFVSFNFKTMNFVACDCGIYNNHSFKCKHWAPRNWCAKKNKLFWSYLERFRLLLLNFNQDRAMKTSAMFLSRVENWRLMCQSFCDDNLIASIWGYDTGIDDRIKLSFSPDSAIRRVSQPSIAHIMTAAVT